jgi:hypothetical protein
MHVAPPGPSEKVAALAGATKRAKASQGQVIGHRRPQNNASLGRDLMLASIVAAARSATLAAATGQR